MKIISKLRTDHSILKIQYRISLKNPPSKVTKPTEDPEREDDQDRNDEVDHFTSSNYFPPGINPNFQNGRGVPFNLPKIVPKTPQFQNEHSENDEAHDAHYWKELTNQLEKNYVK